MANFDPKTMNKEARESVKAAFDALSDWRDEMLNANERYSDKVFDQLGSASEAMGMPNDIVEQTRTQFQSAAKMQTDMMDKMMDAWEKQIDQPGATMDVSADFLKNLQQMSAFGPGTSGMPGMPGMPDMSQLSGMSMSPFHFWMQAADTWQKNYASAMAVWTNGTAPRRKD